VIAIVITVAGVYLAVKWLDSYTLHGETITVPDLKGFHYTEVEPFLDDKKLQAIIIDSINNPEEPRGVVLDQTPKADALVKEGRKVYLTINSLEPPKVVFPTLNDLTLRQAKARLVTYGLDIDSLMFKPSECSRCVIGVMYKGQKLLPGTEIAKGEKVTLIVGSGTSTEQIPLPMLYGKTVDEVESHLFNVGLTMGVISFDETVFTAEDSATAKVFKMYPAFDLEEDQMIFMGKSIDIFLTSDSTKIPDLELIEQDSTLTE
tara:strand:- start:352 stop:1134 length:783 start_codon:yes stop_codon:yes gene_type:complete